MEIEGMDYYEYLEIGSNASIKQIEKAYRRKALRLHPDKNPDDPSAKKNFEKLSEIFNLLSDPKSRGEYDQKLRAKKEKKIKDAELDAKRRKYKEDLEERERKYNEERERKLVNDIQRQKEIDNVRKRNSEILEVENEKIRKEVEKDILDIVNKIGPEDEPVFKLKVEWNRNITNTNASLAKLFSRFGQPSNVKIDKKGDSAYVEYKDRHSVISALKAKLENVTIRGVEVAVTAKTSKVSSETPYGIKPGQSLEDFEKEVLEKIKNSQQLRNMSQMRQNSSNPLMGCSSRNGLPPVPQGIPKNFGPRNEPYHLRVLPIPSPIRNAVPQNVGPIHGNYGLRNGNFPMRFINNSNMIQNVSLQPQPMLSPFDIRPEPFQIPYSPGQNSFFNVPMPAPTPFERRSDFHPWRFG